MRQLVLWVAEKPQAIPPHAKVPNDVCGKCHIQKEGADSVWKRIIATAGHRIHLNFGFRRAQEPAVHQVPRSGGAPLRPGGLDLRPASCHQTVPIKLAKMGGQTSLHCVKCHQFTRGGERDDLAGLGAASSSFPPERVPRLPRDAEEARRLRRSEGPAPGRLRRVPQSAQAGDDRRRRGRAAPRAAATRRRETLSPFHKGLDREGARQVRDLPPGAHVDGEGRASVSSATRRSTRTVRRASRPAAGITPAKSDAPDGRGRRRLHRHRGLLAPAPQGSGVHELPRHRQTARRAERPHGEGLPELPPRPADIATARRRGVRRPVAALHELPRRRRSAAGDPGYRLGQAHGVEGAADARARLPP